MNNENNEPVLKNISSDDVRNIMKAREVFLADLIDMKKKSLKETPPGSLQLSKCRNKPQYYQFFAENTENARKAYIPQDKKELIHSLAQKSYDEKVLQAAEKERRILQHALAYYRGKTIESIFEKLSKGRQEIVKPIEKSREVFVQEWNAFTYSGKGFAPDAAELYTDRGERVRSKSELIIANILFRNNIPYRYECPIQLNGFGTVYPDFTVLNADRRKEFLWEHLGMMDDPVYAEHALQKIQSYITAGIYPGENLILTAETRQKPLNIKIVQCLINKYCLSHEAECSRVF